MRAVARIQSDFPEKFGIPRQSGLVPELQAKVVLEPEFRNPDVFRGLEGFSHIWLLWQFSGNRHSDWSPTVRPPRLGGNARMGVFATRSPFRPNPIGLSCVKLEAVLPEGTALLVSGADLMDGTPILDIKPYVPYADCHPEALEGFTGTAQMRRLEVQIPPALLAVVPAQSQAALLGVLSQDPRPAYQNDPERLYGLCFAGCDIRFRVQGGVLTVCQISPKAENKGF